MVIWHLKQIGKVKKLDKWVPHELTTNQKKKAILKCSLLLFYTTMNHFLVGLWCVTKSGFYTTTGNDQLSGWTKKKLQSSFQSQTSTKNKSWSVFAGVWSTIAFWMPAKPLHKSTLSKSMRCTKNRNTCSQHWSTEWAQFFPMTMPDHRSHNPHFKSWTNWTTKFCLICHIHLTSHQLTTTSSSISTSPCLQGKHFHNQQEAKSAKVCRIPKHGLLCYGDKQTYFSLAKNALIVMVPMLQPSYNV